MRKTILILIPFILFSVVAFAKVSVKATIDDRVISTSGQTIVSVSVEGAEDPLVTPPNVTGLKISYLAETSNISSYSSFSSQSGFNTKNIVQRIFMYRIIPTDQGDFVIGAFKVASGGKTYYSNKLSLKVSQNRTPSNIKTIPYQPYQNSQQNNLPQSSDQRQQIDQQKFWVEATINKKQAYLNEEIIYTFKLYTAEQLAGAELTVMEFKDFLSEVIEPKIEAHEVINGVKYAVYKKVLSLFPTKTGKIVITPAEMNIAYFDRVNRGSQNMWDPFSIGITQRRTKKTTLKTKPITLTVKELPEPAPKNFTGLLGEFGMSAKLNQTKVKVGESVTLEISFQGMGNIRSAVLPKIDIKDVKVYPDKPELETYQSAKGISGRKSYKIVLVPQKAGTIHLNELDFYYFNLKNKQYEVLKTDPITIEVEPSEESQEQTNAIVTNPVQETQTQKITYQDIAPLFSDAHKALTGSVFKFNEFLFLFVYFGLPFCFVLIFVLRKIKNIGGNNKVRVKEKKAYPQLKQCLNKKNISVDQALDAVQKYMSDRCHVSGGALTAKEIKKICVARGLNKKLADKLESIIQELESYRYGFDKQTEISAHIKEILVLLKKI